MCLTSSEHAEDSTLADRHLGPKFACLGRPLVPSIMTITVSVSLSMSIKQFCQLQINQQMADLTHILIVLEGIGNRYNFCLAVSAKSIPRMYYYIISAQKQRSLPNLQDKIRIMQTLIPIAKLNTYI
jgi:hypothetical protein